MRARFDALLFGPGADRLTEGPSGYVLENHDWPSRASGPGASTADVMTALDGFDAIFDQAVSGLEKS